MIKGFWESENTKRHKKIKKLKSKKKRKKLFKQNQEHTDFGLRWKK